MSEKEYRELLKDCGMCTKKWTISRRKQLKKAITEYMNEKNKLEKKCEKQDK